jgi:hypothetical protein
MNIQEGEILVIGDTFAPYDFTNWRECVNYLIDKNYGIKRGMSLIQKDKEHLELRCPLTGEYLTVLASPENLEKIHTQLIIQNLYRPNKCS